MIATLKIKNRLYKKRAEKSALLTKNNILEKRY